MKIENGLDGEHEPRKISPAADGEIQQQSEADPQFSISNSQFSISPEAATDLPRESPRTILFQFVVFPLGVVLIGVAVFLLFGKLASEEHSVPDYVQQISSGSRTERKQAAFELAKALKRGEAKRYPHLEEEVLAAYARAKADDPMVRRYLTVVLGDLHDRRATPLLLDAVNDHDSQTRVYALWALGELRDPVALPVLAKASSDDDSGIRKMAVYALGELGSDAAVPALAARLDDQVPDVRFNAAVALSRFGDRRALPVLRQMIDRPSLARVAGMREDQQEDAMIVAMSAYAKLAGPAASADLQKIAATDPSLRVRGAARSALGR
ncbi:MAG: HEAT repeat domain-containing protein [Acidobacteriota bacterium]